MNQAIHNVRRFFCFFSGEDDFIIRKCNTGIQISFALIGFFVILIFIGCWLSSGLFISHIFDGERWVSIPVGIVWALLVINLYLLLLYSISPALLPVAKKKTVIQKGKKRKLIVEEKKKRINQFFTFSFLFRIALITFLAIIIAQPINVSLFTEHYEEGDRFAESVKNIFSTNPLSWLTTTTACAIMLLPVYFKYGVRKLSQKSFTEDFESKDTAKGLRYLREQLANPVDFNNLTKQILATPINLIRTSDFYFQKALIEYRITLEEYEQFKKTYTSLLVEKNKQYNRICWQNLIPYFTRLEKVSIEKHNAITAEVEEYLQVQEKDFQKYEYWADHPFRTKYKSATRKLSPETDLLQTLYQRIY